MTVAEQWWCPAHLRTHQGSDVVPFERDGIKGQACRETGAVLERIALPLPPAADEAAQAWWCPACAQIHDASAVTPYDHGGERGMSCRLTGAVVQPVDQSPATTRSPSPAFTRPTISDDPNLPTAGEVAGTAGMAVEPPGSPSSTPESPDDEHSVY